MSLIGSLLSLAIIPLRAKVKERPKETDNLAVMALADEVRRLQFALDHWRNAGMALMEENERLREENRQLRQEEAGRQLYSYVQQQAAMNAQNQALAQYALHPWMQNQLGQQHLGQQLDQFIRNCVPSRAEVLTRDFNNGGL